MLFKISKNDVFEDNPHISILSQFKGITSDEFKFVALYADWKSPYKNLPQEQRHSRALESVGEVRSEKMDQYIQAYQDLQGIGPERESLDALESALTEIRKRLKSAYELEADAIKKLSSSLIELTKQRKAIELLINDELNIDAAPSDDADEMSSIDNFYA